MRGAARALSLCLALGCASGGAAFAAGSGQPTIDPHTACATGFAAIRIDGDPNAVIVRASDLPAPFSGTVTAYGHDVKWTATIGRWEETTWQTIREAEFILRAGGPIEGVEYAPTWASCTFHAGTHARGGYEDTRRVDGPVLIATNPVPIEPVTCAVPYRSTGVVRAYELTAPVPDVYGFVRVAVAIDEQGIPQFTRVVVSPGAVLEAPAAEAAPQHVHHDHISLPARARRLRVRHRVSQ